MRSLSIGMISIITFLWFGALLVETVLAAQQTYPVGDHDRLTQLVADQQRQDQYLSDLKDVKERLIREEEKTAAITDKLNLLLKWMVSTFVAAGGGMGVVVRNQLRQRRSLHNINNFLMQLNDSEE